MSKAVIERGVRGFGVRLAALLIPALLLAGTAAASPDKGAASAQRGHLFGDYLAGRYAEHVRDYRAATRWFERTLKVDPAAPELISRTFLMDVMVGDFDGARKLAKAELKLDPSDAIAHLVLLVENLNAGKTAAALAEAQALPDDGVHRFIVPLALAWTRMATKNVAGGVAALQGFDKFNGFAPLKYFQLGLLYDLAGKTKEAEDAFSKALSVSGELNWRLTDAVATFDARHGREAQARALYRRFMKENEGSELAKSVLAARGKGVPPPAIASPADGLAEGLFDLASVLNQPETIDLALIYDRFALFLKPHFALAQLLLADILSAENKPAESLSALSEIAATSPYSWSARLRETANLESLGRTDEAVAQLKKMAAAQPGWIGAEVQLGDLLRSKKRFAEAVVAYDAAIHRAAAAGLPERWTLFYDRGVALDRSGHWKRAEADLLHALKLKPDQPFVLNYLGYSWVDRGVHLKRGLKMIEEAVKLRPQDGYIVDSLGWAHYRLGQYTAAVHYLEKAIEMVPEDPTINDHLGDAYWQTGRTLEARYQWQQALDFGPQKDEIKPIEEKLARGLGPSRPAHGG